ncbi:glycosyltransferase [Nitratireductor sp. CH_MIT9313-5]|uniref:glycosyltransferase n=1 Tax=Nitratireductor sp. CH_MIT9313-5 TaxID=3107764 RepID=UPI003008850A
MRTRVYHHTGKKERQLEKTPLVVVSRFNIFSEVYPHLATAEWDHKRAQAFKKYLLPSLTRQRIKPDAFYFLIDEDIRTPVSQLLEDLKHIPWVKPIVIPRSLGFTRFGKAVHTAIETEFPNRNGLICVRVDSDDALNTHFFNTLEACIQDHILSIDTVPRISFIHFPYGLIKDSETYRVYVEHQTAFISSYTHGNGRVDTCCSYAHDRMSDAGPVLEIATEVPMWLYVRHGDNIGLVHPYRFPISGPFHEVASLFGLQEATSPEVHSLKPINGGSTS